MKKVLTKLTKYEIVYIKCTLFHTFCNVFNVFSAVQVGTTLLSHFPSAIIAFPTLFTESCEPEILNT